MFQFQRVVCVSLHRRSDRWQDFQRKIPRDWPFREIERFDAVDGERVQAPTWWRSGNGAWGCYKSHLNILEQCLQQEIETCLILEDDAVCGDDFAARADAFFSKLPQDWGMIYLGGQLLHAESFPPIRVNPQVYIPFEVNRTHAYAVRGKSMMRKLYQHLNSFQDWRASHHVDHQLGQLHRKRTLPIYCPSEWLIGQDEGCSDVSGERLKRRFFSAAKSFPPVESDFICVVGLQQSGASLVAQMLQKLGVHLGNDLKNVDLVRAEGVESSGLARICENALPFPSENLDCWSGLLQSNLLAWIRDRQKEAQHNGTVAGGAHANFCAMGDLLESTLQGRMKVIYVDRPLQESISALLKVRPEINAETLSQWQAFLWKKSRDFLHTTKVPVLRLERKVLLRDTAGTVEQIITFLAIDPKQSPIEDAIACSQQPFLLH